MLTGGRRKKPAIKPASPLFWQQGRSLADKKARLHFLGYLQKGAPLCPPSIIENWPEGVSSTDSCLTTAIPKGCFFGLKNEREIRGWVKNQIWVRMQYEKYFYFSAQLLTVFYTVYWKFVKYYKKQSFVQKGEREIICIIFL